MARVVIAEDDVDTRALMRAALRPLDLEIHEVGTGLELLERIATAGPFDLIITDLMMPHIDGVRVIAMLRNAGLVTPVLMVTAYPPDDGPAAEWLGQVRLLRKPFGLVALREAASALIPELR